MIFPLTEVDLPALLHILGVIADKDLPAAVYLVGVSSQADALDIDSEAGQIGGAVSPSLGMRKLRGSREIMTS